MHKILYVYYITGLLLMRSDRCENTPYTHSNTMMWYSHLKAHRLTLRKIATQMLIDFFIIHVTHYNNYVVLSIQSN